MWIKVRSRRCVRSASTRERRGPAKIEGENSLHRPTLQPSRDQHVTRAPASQYSLNSIAIFAGSSGHRATPTTPRHKFGMLWLLLPRSAPSLSVILSSASPLPLPSPPTSTPPLHATPRFLCALPRPPRHRPPPPPGRRACASTPSPAVDPVAPAESSVASDRAVPQRAAGAAAGRATDLLRPCTGPEPPRQPLAGVKEGGRGWWKGRAVGRARAKDCPRLPGCRLMQMPPARAADAGPDLTTSANIGRSPTKSALHKSSRSLLGPMVNLRGAVAEDMPTSNQRPQWPSPAHHQVHRADVLSAWPSDAGPIRERVPTLVMIHPSNQGQGTQLHRIATVASGVCHKPCKPANRFIVRPNHRP